VLGRGGSTPQPYGGLHNLNPAEDAIRIPVASPQEYAETYSFWGVTSCGRLCCCSGRVFVCVLFFFDHVVSKAKETDSRGCTGAES